MEQVTDPTVPADPAAPKVPITPSSFYGSPPVQPKTPRTYMIVGGIVVVLVIVAIAYFAGIPMLKGNQKSSEGFEQSHTPSMTATTMPTALPTLQSTTVITETPTLPIIVKDERLEEDYEQIYTLNQKFAFGQKVNFGHELTTPPLYIRFNLTPMMISQIRLVYIGTKNEQYMNTTEISPYAWFEVKVLDAGSGAILDKQGFGKDYTYVTKQNFMVRQKGNYRIEMSGNDVNAEVQMLIGTP